MMITDAEDFFTKGCGRCDRFDTPDCSTKPWLDGLTALRRLCLEAGLEETAKWGHPCYMHAGRNIALFGAFRTDFRFSFFNAELLKDSEGILEPNGPNAATPSVVRFTDNQQVKKLAPVLRAYIDELKRCADAGIKPVKVERELTLPDELAEALDADPELAEAFHALTPGRQKSYIINIGGAKKSETRIARIEKFRDKIFAGKGAMDR
ncbi:YdeI/OmpD-associated family protein [Reinekea blandensis]|nr:YdeI/OmpD-associated family protein [Reinekea blandensis]